MNLLADAIDALAESNQRLFFEDIAQKNNLMKITTEAMELECFQKIYQEYLISYAQVIPITINFAILGFSISKYYLLE
ncbi:MAG: hypothetical protein QNJ74_20250 [Trichodesmium sp. MO_231.B1]|nr:hypothetical protein [Trichodesmium sp. MO_231.B1]